MKRRGPLKGNQKRRKQARQRRRIDSVSRFKKKG